jgi:hypothetical protein
MSVIQYQEKQHKRLKINSYFLSWCPGHLLLLIFYHGRMAVNRNSCIVWLSSRRKSYEPLVHFWLSFRLQRETTRGTTRSTIPRNQDPVSPFRFRVRKVGRPRCAVKPLAQSRQPLPPMILSMKVRKFWNFFFAESVYNYMFWVYGWIRFGSGGF